MIWLEYGGAVLCLAATAANVVQVIRYRRAVRQFEQLNELLFHMAVTSFMSRHLPLWTAWSRMTGVHFSLRLDAEEKRP